jgi:predicted O-methyltransferase YrrM
MTDIDTKYKTEFENIKKYINNDYILKIFYDYGFYIDKKFIELDSNINVYESCFISLLFDIYMDKYYDKKTDLNILEIGLAYGTSALIIINKLSNCKDNVYYTVIDPNQTQQWKNIGITNINNFLIHQNFKLNYKLHEINSDEIVYKLDKKFDISFIDGSHDEKIVIKDLFYSDMKLKLNGLLIVDDILHIGVKNAVKFFMLIKSNYKRISVDAELMDFIIEPKLYDNLSTKKSYVNPNTMFCLKKFK